MLASRSDHHHPPGLALAGDTRGGIGARRARAGGLLERRETLAVGKTGEASGPITGLEAAPANDRGRGSVRAPYETARCDAPLVVFAAAAHLDLSTDLSAWVQPLSIPASLNATLAAMATTGSKQVSYPFFRYHDARADERASGGGRVAWPRKSHERRVEAFYSIGATRFGDCHGGYADSQVDAGR